MWDPLDRHVPNSALVRGVLAGLLWVFAMAGVLAIVGAPVIGGLFLGPFVLVALAFAAQLALSAYRDDGGESRSAPAGLDLADSVADADGSALAILRERYAQGEIDHDEFERRVNRLLDTEDLPDDEQRETGVALERE